MKKTLIVAFDAETTGILSTDQVMEFAAVLMTSEKWKTWGGKCRTTVKCSLEAMAVHGIREEETKGKPLFGKTNFIKYLRKRQEEGYEIYCLAHNVQFDIKFLHREGIRAIPLDTMGLAEFLKSEKSGLQYMRYKYLTKKDEEEVLRDLKQESTAAHSAMGDVVVMIALQRYAENQEGWKGEYLGLNLIHQMKRMHFGKYKGARIGRVEQDYLEWCRENVYNFKEDEEKTKELFGMYNDKQRDKVLKLAREIVKKEKQ